MMPIHYVLSLFYGAAATPSLATAPAYPAARHCGALVGNCRITPTYGLADGVRSSHAGAGTVAP